MNCSCLSICQCDNLETLRVPDRRRSCTQLANFSVQAFTKYLFKKKKKMKSRFRAGRYPSLGAWRSLRMSWCFQALQAFSCLCLREAVWFGEKNVPRHRHRHKVLGAEYIIQALGTFYWVWVKSYLEMNEVRDVEKDPHCRAAQAVGRAEWRNTCFLISTMNC